MINDKPQITDTFSSYLILIILNLANKIPEAN